MNQSIICWKWDDAALREDMTAKTLDLISRFDADTVCVAAHWVTRPFHDPELLARFRECADILHARGKRLCVEACIRNEGAGFFAKYPSERAWLVRLEEIPLDGAGRGQKELACEPVYHYWRVGGTQGPDRILAGWAVEPGKRPATFRPGTKREIAARAWIEAEVLGGKREGDQVGFGGGEPPAAETVRAVLHVDAGAENAGKTALLLVGTEQPIPDLASPKLIPYYRTMLDAAASAHVDGVFSDEWGYDVILKIEAVNPYDDENLCLRHLSVSNALAARYREAFPGHELCEELPLLFYAPEGREEERAAAINRYQAALRGVTRRNDEEMLAAAKEILGPDVFYGIHPTWWGSRDKLNFEFFKNGFYWWEAKREVAQTDEVVILPIRTALAHKWRSPIWYNMWYSMGTLDIKTYYREAWNNLRYGGRTHYHGYECPNEPVVLELRQPGMLESLEETESRIRLAEPWQTTQPDCRALVLFGMEAAGNWAYDNKPLAPWTPENGNLDLILNTAGELEQYLLCDLAPTTEIINGSLRWEDGKLRYGTQEYDVLALLLPEYMDPACYRFLRGLPAKMRMLFGPATRYNDGTPLSGEDAALLAEPGNSAAVPSARELADRLLERGVPANRYENGCLFQDGSALFTADGEASCRNPLHVSCDWQGRRVEFDGVDFLLLRLDGERITAVSPEAGRLRLDGAEHPLVTGSGAP